jgi:hypothetical protein
MTLRMQCPSSCSLTVVEASGQYEIAARGYVQRTYAPSDGGAYTVAIDELLTKYGGEVLAGCEALRVRGRATLVRVADQVTLTVTQQRDQFSGSSGECVLVDRKFVFTGSLS